MSVASLNNSFSCQNSNLDNQSQNISSREINSSLSAKTVEDVKAGPIERALMIIGGLGLLLASASGFVLCGVGSVFVAAPGTLFYLLLFLLLGVVVGGGIFAAGIIGKPLNQI